MNKQALVDRIRANFPRELQELDQWVVWRVEVRDDKPTKVPYNAKSGRKAESNDPATWASFEKARAAYLQGNYTGVGFMFSEHDPYAGVDFDKCVQNRIIENQRAIWMHDLDSYSEFSYSETGVHTIVSGLLPPGGRKSTNRNVEMYDNVRFFVVTGDHIEGTPLTINGRQEQLEELHKTIFPKKEPNHTNQTQPTGDLPQDDQALLTLMFDSKNGHAIKALWDGGTTPYNGDESSADLALCNHLAFWTQKDPERMDRLFRQSGLMRDKWDRPARTGEKYGEGTIARAIADVTEVYRPRNGNGNHKHEDATGGATEPPGDGESVTPTVEDESYLLTEGAHDEGTALCVHRRYNAGFLHSESMGWLCHNGTHWSMTEAESAASRAVTETLIARMDAAAKAGKDNETLKKFVPNNGRVRGAKAQLQTLVSVEADSFDADPDMLNCKNGVVNLRTGVLIPHSTEQRFLHCARVAYNPNADQSPWCSWLADAVGIEMAVWLQMAVGYSVTGHTNEEVMFYLYGPPRSGKGTFTETLLDMLGDPLGNVISFHVLTAQREVDSQNFALAPLHSSRFVAASESNAYERFNEAKVKLITGGDKIQVAFKHKTPFFYRPRYKIWLSSNQPVNADPDDDAVWGRIRVVEFLHSYLGKEDKGLKYDMRSPAILEGVLAWAVEGAMKWFALGRQGLPELERGKRLKAGQRAELDNVQAWLDETCTAADTFTAYASLYLSYQEWCKNRGVEPKKQKGFSQSLLAKGYQNKLAKLDGKMIRGFTGLRLL